MTERKREREIIVRKSEIANENERKYRKNER